MITTIETFGQKFHRTAWTGGDTPTKDFEQTWTGKELIEFFMQDQINDCGGFENLKNWLFNGTLDEKLSIFRNRALLDAWATFKNPVVPA